MPKDNDLFPMLYGPPITWGTARLVYKVYPSSQTLERIAERGGFGWDEVSVMCRNYEQLHGCSALQALWSDKGDSDDNQRSLS